MARANVSVLVAWPNILFVKKLISRLVSVSAKRCVAKTKNLVLVVHQERKCEMSELSTYPQSTLYTQIWPNYYTTIQLSEFGIMRIERCLHATRQSLSFNKQLQVCDAWSNLDLRVSLLRTKQNQLPLSYEKLNLSISITSKYIKSIFIIHCNPVQDRTGGVQGTTCFENRFSGM